MCSSVPDTPTCVLTAGISGARTFPFAASCVWCFAAPISCQHLRGAGVRWAGFTPLPAVSVKHCNSSFPSRGRSASRALRSVTDGVNFLLFLAALTEASLCLLQRRFMRRLYLTAAMRSNFASSLSIESPLRVERDRTEP